MPMLIPHLTKSEKNKPKLYLFQLVTQKNL